MKKHASLLLLFAAMAVHANAQNANSSASQTIQLELTDAIEITFDATGSPIGNIVKLPFNSVKSYATGVQSPEYLLTIKSNKKFNISVNTSSPYFSYIGSAVPMPAMPVSKVLSIAITQNGTGGSTNSPFALNNFNGINEIPQTLLSTCLNGANQQIAVKYRADPSYGYPGGTYTVDAVYTATQM